MVKKTPVQIVFLWDKRETEPISVQIISLGWPSHPIKDYHKAMQAIDYEGTIDETTSTESYHSDDSSVFDHISDDAPINPAAAKKMYPMAIRQSPMSSGFINRRDFLPSTSLVIAPAHLRNMTWMDGLLIFTQYLWFHLQDRIKSDTVYVLNADQLNEYRYQLEYNGQFEFTTSFTTKYHLGISDVDPDNEIVCANTALHDTLSFTVAKHAYNTLLIGWDALCRQLQLPSSIHRCYRPLTNVMYNYGICLWLRHCTEHGLCSVQGVFVSGEECEHFLDPKPWCIPLSSVNTQKQVLAYNNHF